jgi:plastocyanin
VSLFSRLKQYPFIDLKTIIMKLFYTITFAFLFHFTSNATTWDVTVADFSFNPKTVNALVGDVIKFTWAAGSTDHTTTCGSALQGTSLPAGAAPWNADITSESTTFSYTITTAGTYNYGCIPHFAFGMKGTIVASAVLAVKFGTFSISNSSNSALLQWQTFSEENTDYFSIRKSTDATHFYEIGKVNAAGTSNQNTGYQFADKELGSVYKFLYYEIVTVDKDKKESFSPIKMLRNNNIVKENLIVALSPNPITRPGEVQLKFNADDAGSMDVSVFNSTGQRVLTTKMAAFYGLNTAHLHVCDLPKGTYNVVFSLAGKKEIKRVVVL